ncbi:MAG: hypothetical protein N2C14_04480, partial [Planctomycetales bacterium]
MFHLCLEAEAVFRNPAAVSRAVGCFEKPSQDLHNRWGGRRDGTDVFIQDDLILGAGFYPTRRLRELKTRMVTYTTISRRSRLPLAKKSNRKVAVELSIGQNKRAGTGCVVSISKSDGKWEIPVYALGGGDVSEKTTIWERTIAWYSWASNVVKEHPFILLTIIVPVLLGLVWLAFRFVANGGATAYMDLLLNIWIYFMAAGCGLFFLILELQSRTKKLHNEILEIGKAAKGVSEIDRLLKRRSPEERSPEEQSPEEQLKDHTQLRDDLAGELSSSTERNASKLAWLMRYTLWSKALVFFVV